MRRRMSWAGGLVAACVIAVVLARVISREPESIPETARGRAARHLPHRDGRLVRGGEPAEPLTTDLSPSKAELQRLERAADNLEARISSGLPDSERPEWLHALGLVRVAEGRFDDALPIFEELALANPRSGPPQSDLAAVHLLRALRWNRPFDFVLALGAAERALQHDPRLPEALFNRAMALTNLHLDGLAATAWTAYLEVDPRSSWADEASRYLRRLGSPTLEHLWRRHRARLDAALRRNDSQTLRAFARRLPDHTRRHVEDALATWAAGGAGADRALAAASELARVLEETTGDGFLREAVAAIEGARAAEDAARLAGLRAGHLAYTTGMEHYAVQDLDEARPRLVAARDALAAGGSPFAAWPELYLAIIESYAAPEPAFRRLLELRRRLSVDHHPFVVGRIDWNLSTIAARQNRLEPALAWAQSSVALLDRSAGPVQSANARLLVSSAFRNLGQPERAWQERLAALAAIRRAGEPRRVHVALHETVDELLVEGLAATALTVSREVVDQALSWGNATALANARLQRGRILAELGRGEEARGELAAARGHVAEVPSADLRVGLSASIDLVEGGLLAERDPEAAIELLGRALGAREAQGQRYRLGSFLVDRAQAYLRLDEPDRAEADLRRAIAEFEGARGGVRDEALRGSSFETAQGAFEEMVRLQVDRHGDAAGALDYAERARSRLLLDLVGTSPGDSAARLPQAYTAGEIASRVPAGVVLVEYLVMPERLLVWVIARGDVRLFSIAVRSSELDRGVAALRLALRRPSSGVEIRRRAARLHAWLIRPLAEEIAPGTTLVVVPDRGLTRVPFAALFDNRIGRSLVDDHTLVVAPSATLYLAALERSGRAAAGPARDILVLGNPAFDRALHPRLDPLPDAAAEAGEIAALYEKPVLLRGAEATAGAFLARAPDHRIVHFAGHSLLDPGVPSRSRLVFAPEPGFPGALYAQALAGVRLPATELVVLSACRTVEGSAASRESLTGLAAAFLAAGPPVVIASLWKADDEATRVLMVAFHRELRRGADPASALRTAQRRLAREPDGRFRSPAYWAGFVAIGGPSVREN